MQPRAIEAGKSVYTSGSIGVRRLARLRSELRRGIFSPDEKMVGVRGVEPRTLRLSSACSNQLSYTPIWNFKFKI